jgi:hypothetical protein
MAIHGPSPIPIPPPGPPLDLVRDARLVNHEGHGTMDLVELGVTSRGTPMRVHCGVVETELVIATGCIRLATGASLTQVSSLAPRTVARTLPRHACSAHEPIRQHAWGTRIVPRTRQLLFEARS